VNGEFIKYLSKQIPDLMDAAHKYTQSGAFREYLVVTFINLHMVEMHNMLTDPQMWRNQMAMLVHINQELIGILTSQPSVYLKQFANIKLSELTSLAA
jgi:hypothetical protein